ncbi:predicted protein [Plenodomus lingam JN3]|uniref:Predicted protein n=1 Tax=Leptosphaeria maculans (strain JN3 / isolate v23.1.3 / race Av1-4-5-6-7-8) TaxID=985895 RepID=E4ZYU0_LEPMJ|nr:predicted protein [Plenodomus lingam JN3]CBX96616.1 predicted protein [Plenodomus lingam JN3]
MVVYGETLIGSLDTVHLQYGTPHIPYVCKRSSYAAIAELSLFGKEEEVMSTPSRYHKPDLDLIPVGTRF